MAADYDRLFQPAEGGDMPDDGASADHDLDDHDLDDHDLDDHDLDHFAPKGYAPQGYARQADSPDEPPAGDFDPNPPAPVNGAAVVKVGVVPPMPIPGKAPAPSGPHPKLPSRHALPEPSDVAFEELQPDQQRLSPGGQPPVRRSGHAGRPGPERQGPERPTPERPAPGRKLPGRKLPDRDARERGTPRTTTGGGGDHRAIHAFADVGTAKPRRQIPQRGWRRGVYNATRINFGLSPDEKYELELRARVRRQARGTYQIAVLGLKGGAGKTAVTVALGSTLAKVRGDRTLVVDADPGSGNLVDRVGKQTSSSTADLLANHARLRNYNDVRNYTSVNSAQLEVLAGPEYSAAQRPLREQDWYGVLDTVGRYYNLVLADCGNDFFDSVTGGVLSTASAVVVVASASVDGIRQAAVALDWLKHNGYHDLLRRVTLVINQVVPEEPNVAIADVRRRFEPHVQPGRLVVLPWDIHIARGTEIELERLAPVYRRRVLELAAALSDDFERVAPR